MKSPFPSLVPKETHVKHFMTVLWMGRGIIEMDHIGSNDPSDVLSTFSFIYLKFLF